MRFAALNLSLETRFLDHLAPLCEILDMPLILVDEKNLRLMREFYPTVDPLFFDNREINYEQIALDYDVLFQSNFWQADPIAFFSKIWKKKVLLAWCPHGNSDKGHFSSMLSPITKQDYILLYGKQMKERLEKQKLWENLSAYSFIGNYRYDFYRKNREFYDALIDHYLDPFLGKKLVLYAPTWQDEEKSSSFFSFAEDLLEVFPAEFHLIIKPHPLLAERHPARFERIKEKAKEKSHISFLEDFPLIYPLLERVDAYIGDSSSIGYDFLLYKRPMFFLSDRNFSKKRINLLHSCGVVLKREGLSSFPSDLKKYLEIWPLAFQEEQGKMYHLSYGEYRSFSSIKESIIEDCQKLLLSPIV